MSEYKSLREWFGTEKRGDGRKFKIEDGSDEEYFEPIFKDYDGVWYGLIQDGLSRYFVEEQRFALWTPKQEEQTFYRVYWKDEVGDIIESNFLFKSKEGALKFYKYQTIYRIKEVKL